MYIRRGLNTGYVETSECPLVDNRDISETWIWIDTNTQLELTGQDMESLIVNAVVNNEESAMIDYGIEVAEDGGNEYQVIVMPVGHAKAMRDMIAKYEGSEGGSVKDEIIRMLTIQVRN